MSQSRANPWDRHKNEEELPLAITPILQQSKSRYSTANNNNNSVKIGVRSTRISLGQRMLLTDNLQSIQELNDSVPYWAVQNNNVPNYNSIITEKPSRKSSELAALKRTKQQVKTELQTLSSHMSWLILLLPAGLALLALLIPAAFSQDFIKLSVQTATTQFPYDSLSSPAHAHVDWERSRILIQPTKPINACKFMQVTATIPASSYSIDGSNATLPIAMLSSVTIAVKVFLSKQVDLDRALGSALSRSTGTALISFRELSLKDFLPLDDSSFSPAGRLSIPIPLAYESFDIPGIASGTTHYPIASITITSTLHPSTATALFSSLSFKIATESERYAIAEIALRLAAALVSMSLLLMTIVRLYLYLHVSSATTCQEHIESILPEQLTSMIMLPCLIMYQSPLSATALICALAAVDVKDSFLISAGLTDELAQFGLLACTLMYVDGLKYAPGDQLYIYKGDSADRLRHRKSRAGPNPVLFFGPETHWEDETADKDGSGDWWGGWSDSRASGSRRSGASGAGSGRYSYLSVAEDRPRTADREVESGVNTNQNSPARSVGSRDASLDSGRDSSLPRNRNISNSLAGLGAAAESGYSGTRDGFRGKLSVHHPLNPVFIDFIWNKLILLLLSSLSCALHWATKYSVSVQDGASGTIITTPLLNLIFETDSNSITALLFILSGTLNKLLVCLWLFAIVRAAGRTEDKLRTAKFFTNRFSQMAFRLLSFQVYLGVVVCAVWVVLSLLECSRLVQEDGGILDLASSRGSLYASTNARIQSMWIIYVASGYIAPFGSFRLVLLLFISGLGQTIAYTLIPAANDLVRERAFASYNALRSTKSLSSTPSQSYLSSPPLMSDYDRSHAFIALEHDYFLHCATGYKMFCVETALILMELSYQSYYRPDLSITNDGRNVEKLIVGDCVPSSHPPTKSSNRSSYTGSEKSLFPNATHPNNPDGQQTENSSSIELTDPPASTRPRMDLNRLNMSIRSAFYGANRTFGYLAEEKDLAVGANPIPYTGYASTNFPNEVPYANKPKRLIVCFRGTDNQDNVLADLTLSQRALPPLRLRAREFRKRLAKSIRELSRENFYGGGNRSPPNGSDSGIGSHGSMDSKDGDTRTRATVTSPNVSPLQPEASRSTSDSISYTPLTPFSPISPTTAPYSPTPTTPHTHYSTSSASPTSPYALNGDPYAHNLHTGHGTIYYSELDERNRTGNYGGKQGGGRGLGRLDVDESQGESQEHKPAPAQTSPVPIDRESSLCACVRGVVSQLPVVQQALPLVHAGFWEVYTSMRNDVLASVLVGIYNHTKSAILSESGSNLNRGAGRNENPGSYKTSSYPEVPPLQLAFCGHSLGAAIAVLAALDVSINLGSMARAIRDRLEEDGLISAETDTLGRELPDVPVTLPSIVLYTFGSPRVGNKLFCDFIKKRIQTYYRVEVEGDSITMMPPNYLGFYRHCGRRIVIDPHGSGSIIVKPTIVETVLLSKSSYSVVNHSLDCYRVSLEACLEPCELEVYQLKEYRRTMGGGSNLPEWLV